MELEAIISQAQSQIDAAEDAATLDNCLLYTSDAADE